MRKKERIEKVLPILIDKFGKPKTMLQYKTPFELLIAVILSAQCTDERVNMVTKELYKVVKKPEDLANMSIKEIESIIRPTGFYHNKAKNIKMCSETLVSKYNGEVPKDINQLIELPGVGRKTANVVLGDVWGITEGIVVDTHVKRLSNRIGFVNSDNPIIIERELMKFVPRKYWYEYSHYMILHGRDKCKARKANCIECEILEYCKYGKTRKEKVKD